MRPAGKGPSLAVLALTLRPLIEDRRAVDVNWGRVTNPDAPGIKVDVARLKRHNLASG